MKPFYSKEEDPFIEKTGQKCDYFYKLVINGKKITTPFFYKQSYFNCAVFNAENFDEIKEKCNKDSRVFKLFLKHVEKNKTFINEHTANKKCATKIVTHMMEVLEQSVQVKAVEVVENKQTLLTNADKKIKKVVINVCKRKGFITEDELEQICEVSRITIHHAMQKLKDIFEKVPDPENRRYNRKIIRLRGENNGR